MTNFHQLHQVLFEGTTEDSIMIVSNELFNFLRDAKQVDINLENEKLRINAFRFDDSKATMLINENSCACIKNIG